MALSRGRSRSRSPRTEDWAARQLAAQPAKEVIQTLPDFENVVSQRCREPNRGSVPDTLMTREMNDANAPSEKCERQLSNGDATGKT